MSCSTSGSVSDSFTGEIAQLYPTSISPLPAMIAVYLVAIYICQIGYCLLLVLARKPETKVCISFKRRTAANDQSTQQRTLVRGVGLPLVFANWVMAGWAIAWVHATSLALTCFTNLDIHRYFKDFCCPPYYSASYLPFSSMQTSYSSFTTHRRRQGTR